MSINVTHTQRDGTLKIFASARQANTLLYLTARGDDLVNSKIGEGSPLLIQNNGIDTETSVETQFLDDVYLKDGYVYWQNASPGDSVSCEIVLPANTLFPSDNGTGNYDIVDNVPVSNSSGTGNYIMYPIDIVVNRFVNRFLILGTNTVGTVLESQDTALIPKQLKFRFTHYTNTPNSNFAVAINLELYRDRTV